MKSAQHGCMDRSEAVTTCSWQPNLGHGCDEADHGAGGVVISSPVLGITEQFISSRIEIAIPLNQSRVFRC